MADLESAVIATNFGHGRGPLVVQTEKAVHALVSGNVRGIRMLGSCCMSMCYVATGQLSAYFEWDIGGVWDVAAASLIVFEAGGAIANLADGKPLEELGMDHSASSAAAWKLSPRFWRM